jgi:hypothetical protein
MKWLFHPGKQKVIVFHDEMRRSLTLCHFNSAPDESVHVSSTNPDAILKGSSLNVSHSTLVLPTGNF